MKSSALVSYFAGAASALVIVAAAGVPHLGRASPDELDGSSSTGVHTLQPVPEGGTSDSLPVAAEHFAYDPIDPDGELIEPIPGNVEDFFEDYLELDYVPVRIELGRLLFHDPRLSKDNSLSCASCHDLHYAGIDRAISPTGYRGQIGSVNTPSVFNAVFNLGQFWDGRAPDLEAQAGGPPTAPSEMASSWDEISSKILTDPSLVGLFRQAFPEGDFSSRIDSAYVKEAIADFERTLITPNSPFDRYLRGDQGAISEEAKQGYQVFKDMGCIECHNGMAVGGASYQRLGREKDYLDPFLTGVHLGRYNITGREEDKFVFKVGSLRNIALTAPYLHDGSVETLEEVIRVMGEYQLGRVPTDGQVSRIAEFLHSLTGEHEGRPLDQLQNTIEFPTSPGK